MKLKAIALAAILAAAGVPALAQTTTDLGVINNDTEGVGGSFLTGSASFLDTFTFQLSSTQNVSGAVLSSGISNFTLTLLNSSFVPVVDLTPASFSFPNLSAGSYALVLTGAATAPGFYGGNVTAVPEPESYALMLAGLGVVGFIATRRRERV